MCLVLDVGANTGEFGLELAKRNPAAFVHLIEPFPDLAKQMQEEILVGEIRNVVVHELAIGDQGHGTDLHVSAVGDRGTSSMLPFDDNKISLDPYWSIRSDLKHSATLPVQVMSLSSFITQQKIEHIDFIKIDVQGLDVEVLASAGEYIKKIGAGMLEVPSTEQSAMYVGEMQTLCSALNFLEANGFKVVAIKPNDPACNEVNVFFTRSPQTWLNDIQRFKLNGLAAFDGKHYWHACSDSPDYADTLHHQLKQENRRLLDRISELDAEVRRLDDRVVELDQYIERNIK